VPGLTRRCNHVPPDDARSTHGDRRRPGAGERFPALIPANRGPSHLQEDLELLFDWVNAKSATIQEGIDALLARLHRWRWL
jgi:hypothetical protein